ncbi:Hypothetical predicted protein [Octopus vulgaris]|uniref:Uncharacterized protein n=1 Tax=Octopus vulgaris TaxID=6645 RepID=A0AA36FBJ5_OCTVU|nr:Hypothetical predicted protein [Octopus vulgaris]
MSDEFVEYMEDSFGVRMDMDGLRIGNEHSGDSENKRTAVSYRSRYEIMRANNVVEILQFYSDSEFNGKSSQLKFLMLLM